MKVKGSHNGCHRCHRPTGRVYGLPCHACQRVLEAEYGAERARRGRLLYIPDDFDAWGLFASEGIAVSRVSMDKNLRYEATTP